MAEAKPSPLERRFRSAVAAYERNPTEKNRTRMVMAEARWYGVTSRNARKLARLRGPQNREQ
jgi:hypothetical protein